MVLYVKNLNASHSIFPRSAKSLSFSMFSANPRFIILTVSFCTWQHIRTPTLSPIAEIGPSCLLNTMESLDTVESLKTESPHLRICIKLVSYWKAWWAWKKWLNQIAIIASNWLIVRSPTANSLTDGNTEREIPVFKCGWWALPFCLCRQRNWPFLLGSWNVVSTNN